MKTPMLIDKSYFPVKEVPAVGYPLDDNQDVTLLNDTGYKFIVREDTGKVLSCMTDNYKLVTNKSIMQKAEPVLKEQGAVFSDMRVFGNGARVRYKYTFKDTKVEVEKGDWLNPEIIINNSYDGTSEVSAMGGAFRMICSNGLIIGYTIGKEGSRHTVWNNKSDIETIVKSVINKTTTVFTNDFPAMIEKGVKKEDTQKLLELFPGYTMESMVQYILNTPPKNYWDLLNAATWVTTHVMKRDAEVTHKFESRIFDTVKNMAARA